MHNNQCPEEKIVVTKLIKIIHQLTVSAKIYPEGNMDDIFTVADFPVR